MSYEAAMLPPCRVCGARASGVHFGVITCEACTAFYKRSRTRKGPYTCKGPHKGHCDVTTGRAACPSCRLQKCLALGMCREAINKGRIPIEKRAELLLEAKQYEMRPDRAEKENCVVAQTVQNNDNVKKLKLSGNCNKAKQNPSNGISEHAQEEPSQELRDQTDKEPTLFDYGVFYNSKHALSVETSASCCTANNVDASRNVTNKMDDIPGWLSHEESVDWFIDAVAQADVDYALYDPEEITEATAKSDVYYECRKAKEDLVGPLRPMSAEVYNEIYQTTGLDLDDYRAKPAACLADITTDIDIYLAFCKKIPGLSDFSMHDQLTLIKGGLLGWMDLSSLMFYRMEGKTLVSGISDVVWTEDDFIRYFGKEVSDSCRKAIATIYSAHLSQQALAILKVMHIFTEKPEYGDIEDKYILKKQQDFHRDALKCALMRYDQREVDGNVERHLESIYTALGTMNEVVQRLVPVMKSWPSTFPEYAYSKMFKELVGLEAEEELICALNQMNVSNEDNALSI